MSSKYRTPALRHTKVPDSQRSLHPQTGKATERRRSTPICQQATKLSPKKAPFQTLIRDPGRPAEMAYTAAKKPRTIRIATFPER